jgi:putative spermidine/putrescine transport system permease protein
MSALTQLATGPGRATTRGPGGGTWLLLLPALAVLVLLFLAPLAVMATRAFTDPEPGLGNFSWFFGSEAAVKALLRTFTVAGIVTIVCLALAYPYAYLMTVCSPRTRAVLTLLVLLPFWTSLMVRTFAWVVLLQDSGVINHALKLIGVGPIPLIRTTTGVVIGMAQVLLPFMVLPLYAVMAGVDRRLLLAAQSLGAPPVVAFVRVYIPLTMPGVGAGCLTVFITSLGFYVTPSLLGSPDRALISQQIFTQVNGLLAWGRGGAMGVVLLVVTLALLGFAVFFMRMGEARRTRR